MRRVVLVGLLAACGGKSSPPLVTSSPPKVVPAAAPACIQPLEEATLAITHAMAVGDRVEYCIGGNADQCFAIDTASGTFSKLSAPPKPATPTEARVETTNPDLKVCQADQCKTLTAKVIPAASQIRAATNASGTTAVFLLGDAAAGKGYAEIWDVAAQKKVTSFKYARGEFKCGDVAIIDDTIYLATATCTAPAARAALYSLKGKKIANVGGPDFGVYGNAYASVDTQQWAFLEENGAQLVIQDLVKGKVVKKIDTSALFKDAGGGAAMGNPGESALIRVGPGKLAVIGGAPATGHVALVDIATGEVKVLKATVCTP